MFAALIPFLAAIIDESPAIIMAVDALLTQKKQQYATVLASINAATSAEAQALEASK